MEGPPPDFLPLAPKDMLLNIAFWINKAHPVPVANGYGLGTPSSRRSGGRSRASRNRAALIQTAPSIATAVTNLTSACTYAAEMPFITVTNPPIVDPILSNLVKQHARSVGSIATVPTHPPAAVPVSTATHDCSQLVWNDRMHLCASAGDCSASKLPGAPGPLPFYIPPGGNRETAEQPAFCLVCIRTDAAAVSAIARKLSATSEHSFGMVPICLPPFQNLVNCADGYYAETLGVTPSQDVFSPVSIVGPNIPMTVEHNAVDGIWYINQDLSIWKEDQPYLNGVAPAHQPRGAGWRSLQKPPGVETQPILAH